MDALILAQQDDFMDTAALVTRCSSRAVPSFPLCVQPAPDLRYAAHRYPPAHAVLTSSARPVAAAPPPSSDRASDRASSLAATRRAAALGAARQRTVRTAGRRGTALATGIRSKAAVNPHVIGTPAVAGRLRPDIDRLQVAGPRAGGLPDLMELNSDRRLQNNKYTCIQDPLRAGQTAAGGPLGDPKVPAKVVPAALGPPPGRPSPGRTSRFQLQLTRNSKRHGDTRAARSPIRRIPSNVSGSAPDRAPPPPRTRV